MRILVHDYAGHPFQVQLSRHLAGRGHEVLHVYCGSTHTPRGALSHRLEDPDTLHIECIDLGGRIPKSGFVRRLVMESQYGKRLVEVCHRYKPEVVLSGNTPSLPQKRLATHCDQRDIRHVFWVQDVYGVAAYKILKRKFPGVGHAVGKYFMALDRASARLSNAVVVITEDFVPVFKSWGVLEDRIHVVHNWADLEELSLQPRDNSWSRSQGLTEGPRFIYSGTLSMRHNPRLLLELAKALDERGEGELLVISEGSGVDWLQEEATAQNVKSLRCTGFQPFETMSEVLGSADVLVAILEPDAGVFCVPSKVLSYMCAGRALLAAMPLDNLAARLIASQGAGEVVAPDQSTNFCSAALELLDSPDRRSACGKVARQYAEENFGIDKITTQFEEILVVS